MFKSTDSRFRMPWSESWRRLCVLLGKLFVCSGSVPSSAKLGWPASEGRGEVLNELIHEMLSQSKHHYYYYNFDAPGCEFGGFLWNGNIPYISALCLIFVLSFILFNLKVSFLMKLILKINYRDLVTPRNWIILRKTAAWYLQYVTHLINYF